LGFSVGGFSPRWPETVTLSANAANAAVMMEQ